MISVRSSILALFLLVGAPLVAAAVPILQLDIAGGHYDSSTETIVTGSDMFTVYAYVAPPTAATTPALLGRTY